MTTVQILKPFKIISMTVPGIPPISAPQAFQKLESVVSLKGRKFYGIYDSAQQVYHAGARLMDGDDSAALGLEIMEVAGGAYATEKLTGPYNDLVRKVPETFEKLEHEFTFDRTRLPIEFYKRHTEFVLMLPITQ